MTVLLVALAFAFAWSIGSHYTGACMGMPYALGAISARNALLLMAPLALLGAWLASGKVATTVGRDVVCARDAGLVCGIGIALGVLVTGRGLLDRVAFDIVDLDRVTATTAQLVQALVILVAVSFGYFTSMNQALVGAMAGAGAARGRHAVK